MIDPLEIDQELEWLEGRVMWGMKVGLETMQVLCERLGHPERSFRSILVGGTNGKGSVSSLLAHLLSADLREFRIGLYTSPHLVGVQERVWVAGEWISSENLALHLRQIRLLSADRQPTFFEVMTLVAFLEFARQKVDFAIVEVGLGGRLDSTNVLDPVMSLITSIGLDHTEILGSTEEQILAEKCGIARPGRAFLSAVVQPHLSEILRSKSGLDYELHELDQHVAVVTELADLDLTQPRQRNQGLAILALHFLLPDFSSEQPISDLLRQFTWPGRWQWLSYRGCRILIDGAHNADGARALVSELKNQGLESVNLVVAMVGDKDSSAWFAEMRPVAREVFLCKGRSERFKDPEVLQKFAPAHSHICDSWQSALDQALQLPGDLLISGSLYLIGEVIETLREECPELQKFRGIHLMTNERAVWSKKA